MKKVNNKIIKQWFDSKKDPDAYENAMKEFNIVESDNIMEEDLKAFDKQLEKYKLEINWFENGSAICYYIVRRWDKK